MPTPRERPEPPTPGTAAPATPNGPRPGTGAPSIRRATTRATQEVMRGRGRADARGRSPRRRAEGRADRGRDVPGGGCDPGQDQPGKVERARAGARGKRAGRAVGRGRGGRRRPARCVPRGRVGRQPPARHGAPSPPECGRRPGGCRRMVARARDAGDAGRYRARDRRPSHASSPPRSRRGGGVGSPARRGRCVSIVRREAGGRPGPPAGLDRLGSMDPPRDEAQPGPRGRARAPVRGAIPRRRKGAGSRALDRPTSALPLAAALLWTDAMATTLARAGGRWWRQAARPQAVSEPRRPPRRRSPIAPAASRRPPNE